MEDLFAVRLRKERQKKRWSNRYLAESIGVNENTYHHYEYGNCKPSLPKLILLATQLNVSLDYLCGRSRAHRSFSLPPDADIHQLLAENLKQLRQQTGLTQKETALALDIHEHTYQYYEIQKRLPTYQMFLRLADFYQIPVDRLIMVQANPS